MKGGVPFHRAEIELFPNRFCLEQLVYCLLEVHDLIRNHSNNLGILSGLGLVLVALAYLADDDFGQNGGQAE